MVIGIHMIDNQRRWIKQLVVLNKHFSLPPVLFHIMVVVVAVSAMMRTYVGRCVGPSDGKNKKSQQ
jgi:hypothetical protein